MNIIKPDPNDKYQISKAFLKKLIQSDIKSYYYTSSFNDCLYLHYKGFQTITNLESYTGLKVLYLQGNNIKQISGLETLTGLKTLYLQQNIISRISGLDCLTQLVNLNLSDNLIERVEGLENLKKLESLYLKCNQIGKNGLSDLIDITKIQSLTLIDLSDNRVSDPLVLQVLTMLPSLSVLYLFNNIVTKSFSTYRKTFTFTLSSLKYLDTKPVFADQRRFAQAWKRGGNDEQKKERIKYAQQKQEEKRKIHEDFREAVQQYKKQNVNQEYVEEESESNISLQTYNTCSAQGEVETKERELEMAEMELVEGLEDENYLLPGLESIMKNDTLKN